MISRATMFKSLSIGCVFNFLFPFRLGEFIRAHLLGRHLLISRSAVFCTVLFERALDGLFLSLFFLALSPAGLSRIEVGSLPATVAFIFLASCAILRTLGGC